MHKTLLEGLKNHMGKTAGAVDKAIERLSAGGAALPILGLGAALAGANVVGSASDTVGKIITDRYQKMNEPTWQALGQSNLYQNNPELINYQKAQEALLKLKYEKPVDIGSNLIENAIGGVGSNMATMLEQSKAQNAFNQISSSPIVQALGEEKAKAIYNQLTAIAPKLVRKAPGTALSVMANSMDNGGQATIDPNMAMNLARAAGELNKM